MGKIITDKPMPFCLPECNHMSLDIKTSFMFADEAVVQTTNVIYCRHEDACKMWHDKGQQQAPNTKSPNELRAEYGCPPIEEANWDLWGGWRGNHDRRIEDATCSNCGYIHPKVFKSLDNLVSICPVCKRKMTTVHER